MPAIVEAIGPVYRGSDVSLTFTTYQPGGTTIQDITSWTISWRLKQNLTDITTLLTVNASVVSGPAGMFTVGLTAAQTQALQAGTYQWDVWRTDTGSANPLALGPMTVQGSVTVP